MLRFTASDGSIICFRDIGSGPPLVFLHGWMMSGAVWNYQSPLSGSFRVITPDLRGHGDSRASFFSYPACRNDLVNLFDYLSLENVTLVGWSMGAQIAIYSWPELRERVAALVLVSGTPRFCSEGEYRHGVPVAEVRTMRARLVRSFERTAGEFFKGMFAPGELSQTRYAEIARNVSGRLPSRDIALAALDSLIHTDLSEELQNIRTSSLLLHGDADKICPVAASRFMQEKLCEAKMKIFDGSGHAPFLSRDAEFNRIVQEFAQAG